MCASELENLLCTRFKYPLAGDREIRFVGFFLNAYSLAETPAGNERLSPPADQGEVKSWKNVPVRGVL